MADLIFDYDGTVHETLRIYEPAFRNTYGWLVENGYAQPKEISSEEIGHWLGYNSTDMWNSFMPGLDPEIKEKARIMLGEDMAERIESGQGALYPGAEEVLLGLREQGHTLIFLSNCRIHYMERHRRAFRLERFFHRFYCCEEFGFIPKYEIFRRFAPELPGPFIVIGDRFHDIETAAKNGLRSVGCGYGYGTKDELSAADIIINDVKQLPAAVEELLR
ncbi:MAG: HAD hydrolase-like protein [Ruminococcus sp.]|nr:HAD hydrolase-like protein [Ruminococcus sp.]